MKLEIALYLEIDILFVFILAVLAKCVREISSSTLHDKMLRAFLTFLAAILVVDCFTCISDGGVFPGARIMGIVSNSLGFALSGVVSLMWALYVEYKVTADPARLRRKFRWLVLPAAVQAALALLSQPLHLIFYIDADAVYHRAGLYWLQAGLCSFYLLYAIGMAHYRAAREHMRARRTEYRMLAFFGWFPFLGGLFQILCYGLPTLWPMTVCATTLVVMNLQRSQITTDALTGLNNRGRLDQYLSAQAKEFDRYQSLYLIVIDVDNFKRVNDTYGHIAGDAALNRVAGCLRRVAARNGDFVARYGGDEFSVVCRARSAEVVENTLKQIRLEVRADNEKAAATEPQLTLSMGYAALERGGGEGAVEQLIEAADAKMYEAKRLRHEMEKWGKKPDSTAEQTGR